MADIKISDLTAATTPLGGTEVLPIVQSGVTVKVAVSNLTAGRSVSATAVAITGSTSGTATIVTPAVAGTPTITLPTITGTISIDGPAFSAYQTTSTAVTNATFTKVLFDVERFDTNSNFASSRFTPTVAGYYQVSARLGTTSATITRLLGAFYKNGSSYQYMSDGNYVNPYSTDGSTLVSMNGSTDYLEVYVFMSGAPTTYDGGIATTWFQSSMIRGA